MNFKQALFSLISGIYENQIRIVFTFFCAAVCVIAGIVCTYRFLQKKLFFAPHSVDFCSDEDTVFYEKHSDFLIIAELDLISLQIFSVDFSVCHIVEFA